MKMKLPAAISRVPQLFGRSHLGFWMPLGSPFKNTSKLEKCQKSREIAIFGRPSVRFSIKIETSGGHNSSTPWSWRLPSGFLDAPWILLHKSIFSEKVTRDPPKKIDITIFDKIGPKNREIGHISGTAGSYPDLIGPMPSPSGGAYLIIVPHPATPQRFPAKLLFWTKIWPFWPSSHTRKGCRVQK